MWTTEEIRNYKIKDEHDITIFRAYGMLRDRAVYHQGNPMGGAYESACAILEYAMTDDLAGLRQFDYYTEEN